MSLDPAFYEFRQKPLPTLPERRRLIRERLVKTQAELNRMLRKAAAGSYGTLKARRQAKRLVRKAAWEVYQLTEALRYLGEPDPRLDLYRLFGMDLPENPPRREAER
jgi:hypothetical protein